MKSPGTQNISSIKLNTSKKIHFIGDWTITDLPNTLESAAISGINLVKNKF